MPTVLHSSLTGAELHEPKGIAGAGAGTTYVANGSGSGTWTQPEPKGIGAAADGSVYEADGAGSGAWVQKNQYATIYTDPGDTATLGSIGTTVQTFQFAHDGPENGLDGDATLNRITVTVAGDYEVSFLAALSTVAGADSGLYTFKIAINGSPTVVSTQRNFSGTNDHGQVVLHAIIPIAASAVVTVSVESDEAGDSDDLNIHAANLTVKLLKAS